MSKRFFASLNFNANSTVASSVITGGSLAMSNVTVGNLISTNTTISSLILNSITTNNLAVPGGLNITNSTISSLITPNGSVSITGNCTIANVFITNGNISIGRINPSARLVVSSGTTVGNITFDAQVSNTDYAHTYIGFNGSLNAAGYFGDRINTNKSAWFISADQTLSYEDNLVIKVLTTSNSMRYLARFRTDGHVVLPNGYIKSSIPSWCWTTLTGDYYYLWAAQVIPYQSALVSTQNCTQDLANGRMTCTIAGRYFVFLTSAGDDRAVEATSFEIRKNNVFVTRVYEDQKSSGGFGATESCSAIVDLAVGDYLDTWVVGGAIHRNYATIFGGYMIG